MIRCVKVTGVYIGEDCERAHFAFWDTVRDKFLAFGYGAILFESRAEFEECVRGDETVIGWPGGGGPALVERCRSLIASWVPDTGSPL